MSVWRLGPEGTTVAHHLISVPGRYVSVEQAVRRGDGYALLLRVGKPKTYSSTLRVAALTAEGELDTTWGDGGYRSITGQRASIGGAPDGSVLVAINRTTRCVHRKVRPTLRVQRLAPDGRPARVRTHVLGRKLRCISMHPGEMHADRRGRVAIAVGRSDGGDLLRLRRDLRRDRRFGRSGIVRLTRKPTWWRPVELAPRSGGGFGVGFTTTDGDDTPHAHVALVGAGGRLIRARRLRVMRSYPSSELSDLTFDRAGRLVAAGMLRDDNVFIREDYGRPHLAVWRLRTTRSSSARTTEDRPRSRRRGARGPR